jgi:large subunit ribosomal protein L29
MKNNVIRELSTEELIERLEEEKKHLTKMKLNNTVSTIENPNKIREYKKTIARMLTELRKREIEETDKA